MLQIDRDFSGDLIEDPVGKHGESLQSELELTAGHMEVYLSALQSAIELAVPDLRNPPKPYVLKGNDWEKQHYLNRNDLAHGNRRKHRRYRGPNGWATTSKSLCRPITSSVSTSTITGRKAQFASAYAFATNHPKTEVT